MITKVKFFIVFLVSFISVSAQTSEHGRIVVHPEGRYLQYEDGTPFFYLGDTAWELFHRLNKEDTRIYLSDRQRKGYNVIQAVVLAEMDGLNVPNVYGDLPFTDKTYSQPNEGYFRHVDRVIELADSLGMVVGLLPTWGDKFNIAWGLGPVIFDTPDKAEKYGRFLGERYKHKKNIIWILGGDRDAKGYETIIRAMAKGIVVGICGKEDYSTALMTYHPAGGQSSATLFHNDAWLDFNMQQNGHCYDVNVWERIQREYNCMPTKPVIDGEPLYDEHPICAKREQYGTSTDFHVRRFFYHELFSGACGYTHGCHALWQMWTSDRKPINGPLRTWKESLSLSASRQIGYGRKLMESRPFYSQIPDQSIILSDTYDGTDRITATKAIDGSFALIYTESGKPFEVALDKLSGDTFEAAWFDVRNGQFIPAGTMQAIRKWFYPPTNGQGNDWVLTIDKTEAL
jgi:hypothetical protein